MTPAFIKPLGPTAKRRARKQRDRTARYRVVCRAVDARDGQACRVCGCCLIRGAHHHHVIPRSLGGKDTLDNLILVCQACHADIHNKRQRTL